MRFLNDIAHAFVSLFTGDPPRSMAPEILAKMRLAVTDLDAAAFIAGTNELLDDSVRLVYDAKLVAMTRRRRMEVKSMDDDERASWLYDMCVDSMVDLPPLKARMMLSAACARHARRVR